MDFVWKYVSPGVWVCNMGSGMRSGLVEPSESGTFLASVFCKGALIAGSLSFSKLEGAKRAVEIQLQKLEDSAAD